MSGREDTGMATGGGRKLDRVEQAGILADALLEVLRVESGPRRLGQTGAPMASASPYSWGLSMHDWLSMKGYELVKKGQK